MTSWSEAMWQTLGKLSLEERHLYIAERCYAALGDVAKVRYLQGINSIREQIQATKGKLYSFIILLYLLYFVIKSFIMCIRALFCLNELYFVVMELYFVIIELYPIEQSFILS